MNSSPEPVAPPAPRPRAWLWLALGVACVLRVWEAAEASLWLDELHTLSHASLPDVGAVIAHVRAEVVHQPLFFVCVHLFGGWEEGAALRFLPVLSSLALFVPVLALARQVFGNGRATALTAWLLACLPYQVHYATELRPYAWLAVFSAGAVWAAFGERGPRWTRLLIFALCVAAGVMTHRIMEIVVLSIGAARLIVRSKSLLPLPWLIVAGALAVAPEVPWLLHYAEQATSERFAHQDSNGVFTLRTALVLEALALPTRLVAPFMGALGGAWAWLARSGAALLLFAIVGALLNAWRRRREAAALAVPLRGVLVFSAICFALVFGLSFYRWDRLPLQYFAPVAWVAPLAFAALVERWPERSRPQLTGLLGLAALVLGVAQAGGKSTEDMRGAVAVARQIGAAEEAPIYSGLLSQPSLFEHTLPYRAYARDLETVEPERLPRPGEPGFERPVIVLRRGRIPFDTPGWAPIRDGRRVVSETHVDDYLTVFVFAPKP